MTKRNKKTGLLKQQWHPGLWSRLRLLCVGLGAIAWLMMGAWFCSDPNAKKVCLFEEDCQDNERCIYPKESCNLLPGSCEGVCELQKPDAVCACRQDDQCKYPQEECVACRCVKRNVKECRTPTDCGQGEICVGELYQTCETRVSCKKDSDCKPELRCKENLCCNLKTGTCPRPCQTGAACDTDNQCLACGLRCRNGACREPTAGGCLGKTCKSSADCASCRAQCRDGICQEGSSGGACRTATCRNDQDCKNKGYSTCEQTCCR